MKPDVIVTWPWTCDYPLWRKFIAENRERFAKVIVVFSTNTVGQLDYREFVRANFPGVTFIDSPERPGNDWRDVAVNAGLDASDAEWVWFTEPDFFVHDVSWFFDHIAWASERISVIGWEDSVPRLHPSCLFVRRVVIDDTMRYFGPLPNDHFVAFSRELWNSWTSWQLQPKDFEHLQGLSYNHELVDRGQPVTFNPERFHRYLADCLVSGVTLDPRWAERAEKELGMVRT